LYGFCEPAGSPFTPGSAVDPLDLVLSRAEAEEVEVGPHVAEAVDVPDAR
jgi:hypothetical protein